MKVSKEKAAENREALLAAASRLFREKGIDGVGVADIAREAGLTHGALYAHFASKDALAAEAFSRGFAENLAGLTRWRGTRSPSFDEYMGALFSLSARDRLADGCPMTASTSEVARQGPALSASFLAAFEETVAIVESSLDTAFTPARRRQLAVAAVAAQIGAIAVSRAVAQASKEMSDEVLGATRQALVDAAIATRARKSKS